MRIVKEGRRQYQLYGDCKRCGCEVEADKDDKEVQLTKQDDHIGKFDNYWCFCPTDGCNAQIVLNERSGR